MTQICYYGDKISPHMAMTPEGFLICKGVPIARTGYQHYLESELYEDGDSHKVINVYRPQKEVFSQATLASFEGKPVTNGHPDEDVTPDNYNIYQKGHVQHVRAGTGDDANKIIADLYITDRDLIHAIQNGKREVSAGYYAEDCEDDHGRVCQTKIRGNHVAVVDNGRAGASVAIRDEQTVKKELEMRSTARKQAVARKIAKRLLAANGRNIDRIFLDAADELSDEADVVVDEDEIVDEDEVAADEDEVMDEDDLADEDEVTDEDDVSDEDELTDEDELADEDEVMDEDDLADEDEVMADDDFTDEDDFSDEDEEIMDEDDLADEDFGDACKDEDLEDEDLEDEDLLDEEFGDDDLIAADKEEPATALGDSAIRKISAAAMQIRNKRDRQRVQDAILWAVSGKGSQMNDVMKEIRKKRRDSMNGNINTVALQKTYDRFNPHKKGGKR